MLTARLATVSSVERLSTHDESWRAAQRVCMADLTVR